MPDTARPQWPGRVAVAVIRRDPPEVFIASDAEVLGRVLATQVVARTPAGELTAGYVATIREALLEERWGDAVAQWIDATGDVVDAYPDDQIWTDERLDAELASLAIRMAPIFEADVRPPPGGSDSRTP